MGSDAFLTTLEIDFADESSEAESDDPWVAGLRRDVLDAGAVSVEPQHVRAPEGSRAIEGAIAALFVQAAPGAVAVIVSAIKDLLKRSSVRRRLTVRIGGDELVLDGATSVEQERLVAAFLARHSAEAMSP
jgi:hypothetical protein